MSCFVKAAWLCALTVLMPSWLAAQTLEESLQSEDPSQLVADAMADGDARRGAILFFQPFMSCRQCHDADTPGEQLGPDLSRWEQSPREERLVDAVLRPSKEIREGYESLTVVTRDGQTVVGLIVKHDDEEVVLRDPSQPGKLHHFQRHELDEVMPNANSLMPAGLANQLSSRQQFLDLLKYLIEIRDGGPLAARNLQPAPHLYAAQPLPEYENQIDHAGMIRDLGPENFRHGEAIYNRVCVNCHGTHAQPGSLPTSLRFSSGRFKNGSDPYTMYQTLTRGFGMMQPQSWMVPQQKYDVIHYIREAYLKSDNPTQYRAVEESWLASLPKGDARGPSPLTLEPWVTMDYGRTLINTYEIGGDGSNFAYKGIAVRLDGGPGGISRGRHWMIFDHDTLRMAAAWTGTGFIDWRGIHFNGQHGVHPRIVGQLQAENKTGPGWAEPTSGEWEERRVVGRDGRRYGPLPRAWGQYLGMYLHGNQTVISYRVGTTHVLERPELLTETPRPVYARRLDVGPRPHPLTLQVAQLDETANDLAVRPAGTILLGPKELPEVAPASNSFAFDGAAYAQVDEPQELDMTSRDFTIVARIKTKLGGTVFAKTDPGPEWVPDGKAIFVRDGRLCYDIGWVGAIESRRRVDDDQWHDVAVSWDHDTGRVRLFIDGQPDAQEVLRPKQRRDEQVVRLGYAAPDFPQPHSFFRGSIETLAFFNSQLSADQIAKRQTPSPLARWEFASAGETISNLSGDRYSARVIRSDDGSAAHRCLLAGTRESLPNLTWECEAGALRLTIPAGDDPVSMTVWFAALESSQDALAVEQAVQGLVAEPPTELAALTDGGPARFPERVETQPTRGSDEGPFAVDTLTCPEPNPWLAQVRLTGFDFFPDGDTAAICSWDGDVWKVTGIDGQHGDTLEWQRIASGLFQPLGLLIVNGDIYVTCRDQLAILRDRNGDGETDFVECFNNDHQVTDHFHEFAMGLQRDQAGNFYYAKSARHALTALVPHHGTLLRVSPDGARTDIVANGFRAANGVCLNPDGTFIVTDQEGHWNPKNRVNWVHEGGFYGNMFGYHDVTDPSDSAMEQPLCWITNDFDRSPAELLWVPTPTWGPLGGSLLSLSYGYGKIFVVPYEQVDGQMQGGMCELPIPQFPTGLARGRFHPADGQLYVCGMFAWGGNQQQPGGFYRVRATGKPMHLPVALHARKDRLEIAFTDPLARHAAENPDNYSLTAWDLKRSANYGSEHYNQRAWKVTHAELSPDGRTVILSVPELAPTWGMEIRCFLESEDGRPIERRVHNSIHHLPE